jgi:hypothetical protein
MVKRSVVWTTLALVVTAAAAALPAQAPPKPDSPEVVRLLETAKADAVPGGARRTTSSARPTRDPEPPDV